MSFQALDKNADQKISKTEAAADHMLTQSFTRLDANSDGSLTTMEFASYKQPSDSVGAPRQPNDSTGTPRSENTEGSKVE